MTMLTKEQLLAMPESEYMSADQLRYFEDVLRNQLTEITMRMAEATQLIRQRSESTDSADVATDDETRQINMRQAEHGRIQCRRINAALERIKSQEYGWCEITGEAIGLKRLLLNPTAELSIEAQIQREALEKHMARSLA